LCFSVSVPLSTVPAKVSHTKQWYNKPNYRTTTKFNNVPGELKNSRSSQQNLQQNYRSNQSPLIVGRTTSQTIVNNNTTPIGYSGVGGGTSLVMVNDNMVVLPNPMKVARDRRFVQMQLMLARKGSGKLVHP